MNLTAAILHLFPGADPLRDFVVCDHGSGTILQSWHLPEPKPTEQELGAAWVQVQAKQAAADALWNARLAMAHKYHALPVEIRNRYRGVYNDINQALQRDDVELALYSLQNMTVQPGDEQLHAEFLAMFPNG